MFLHDALDELVLLFAILPGNGVRNMAEGNLRIEGECIDLDKVAEFVVQTSFAAETPRQLRSRASRCSCRVTSPEPHRLPAFAALGIGGKWSANHRHVPAQVPT